MMLRALDISVAFGQRVVLKKASLAVSSGEVVGVIGANGAGKSTVLRVLAGVQVADAGRVAIGRNLLTRMDAQARARHVGYLPQRPLVDWPLSIAEVAALGRLPHLPWWQGADTGIGDAPVRQALAACDLEDMSDRRVDTLSGGEFARAMLARLLAGQHDVLIADEPIADLDPPHRVDVMRILAGEAARGAGVVVALHDLSLADRFCDRVIVLSGGHVFAQGAPRSILDEGVLTRTFGARCTVARSDGHLAVMFDGSPAHHSI